LAPILPFGAQTVLQFRKKEIYAYYSNWIFLHELGKASLE